MIHDPFKSCVVEASLNISLGCTTLVRRACRLEITSRRRHRETIYMLGAHSEHLESFDNRVIFLE